MFHALKEADALLSGALRAAESGRLFSRQQASAIAESLLPLAERHGWTVAIDAALPYRVRLLVDETAWVTVLPGHGRPSFSVTVDGGTVDAGRDVPMQAVPLFAQALALGVVGGWAERSAA